jgi:hypothetical protein
MPGMMIPNDDERVPHVAAGIFQGGPAVGFFR